MSNHVERVHAAVSVIVGHGEIKQRLISAYEDNLAAIDAQELPVPIREKFLELRSLMTGVKPLNGEGHIRATVRKMSTVEADNCAHRLLDIYTELARVDEDAEEAETIHIGGEQPRIPPFLLKNVSP